MKAWLLLELLPALAAAQSPQAVYTECVSQMKAGVCIAQADRTRYPASGEVLVPGVGRLPISAYLDIRELANPDDPSDTRMCDFALAKMVEEPTGPHAQVARLLWPVIEGKKQEVLVPAPAQVLAVAAAALALALAWRVRT